METKKGHWQGRHCEAWRTLRVKDNAALPDALRSSWTQAGF
jgi:hypothetical protein